MVTFCIIRIKQVSEDVVCRIGGFVVATAVDFIGFDGKRHVGFEEKAMLDGSSAMFSDSAEVEY
jgi:hypothetical protein